MAEIAASQQAETTGDAARKPQSAGRRVVTGRALLLGTFDVAGVGLVAPWAIHILGGGQMIH